jgi:hypothetical protein
MSVKNAAACKSNSTEAGFISFSDTRSSNLLPSRNTRSMDIGQENCYIVHKPANEVKESMKTSESPLSLVASLQILIRK